VVVLFAFPMVQTQPGVGVAQALIQSVSHWLTPTIMCVGIWKLSEKLAWPPRSTPRFVAIHALLAIVFSSVWLGVDVSFIILGVGLRAALVLARSFEGFQWIDGLFFYAMIAAGSYAVRMVGRLRAEEARVARAESLRMRAELAALRGQLNPHFLFNTLHTLTALVRRDPATAENALERFGDMLRYVLDVKRSEREDVTLADEMDFVRNYLALEQLRFGARLRVVEHIEPDALEAVLPSLTLQPLVENAIRYGIAPRASGGTIEIDAAFVGEQVEIVVRDDGPGAAKDILDSAAGVGLRAVRQRLATRFEGRSGFTVATSPGDGFAARITLPAHAVVRARSTAGVP
jgi:sensor histidine kinase YesM